jgi:hypothetical protein
VRSSSALVAIGVRQEGCCEILGVAEGMKEERESWRFLSFILFPFPIVKRTYLTFYGTIINEIEIILILTVLPYNAKIKLYSFMYK